MPTKKIVKKTKGSPKPTKPTQSAKSAKSAKPTTPPVPTPVKEVDPIVSVEVKKTSTEVTDTLFNDLQAQLSALSDAGIQIPGLKKGLISLKKSMDKERKELLKAQPKKKSKSASSTPRAPSGFAKPAAISKDLAKFIGVKPETLVARTAVTRYITTYIKENDLQDPSNKRVIIPDSSLKKLLGVTDKSDPVTYFNLQRFLKGHYPPSKAKTQAV
jgi:chromatin remodeling complex protein RSC6